MNDMLTLGAVAYDPKVITIWEGFQAWLGRKGLEVDYVLYSTYERQVESLVRLVADVADRWQIPTDRIFSHAEVAIPAGRKQDMGQQAPAIREMVEAVRARKSAVFQSARR